MVLSVKNLLGFLKRWFLIPIPPSTTATDSEFFFGINNSTPGASVGFYFL
jgi:hypothetical protein